MGGFGLRFESGFELPGFGFKKIDSRRLDLDTDSRCLDSQITNLDVSVIWEAFGDNLVGTVNLLLI